MAKGTFRPVQTGFWTDNRVVEEFSPEDRYFYLYLTTNPHMTQIGIYHFAPKVAAFEMGYSKEAIIVLLDRFEKKYGLIKYSSETNEVAIKDYLLEGVISGGDVLEKLMLRELQKVECTDLINYIYNNIYNKQIKNLTVLKIIKYIKNTYVNVNAESDIDSDIDSDTESGIDSKKSQDKASHADFFDQCWQAYPRKKGKGQVKAATKKRLAKEVGMEQMLRCIERYKAEMVGKDEQYVMYGSTFFNSGYVDYLDENYETKNDLQSQPKEEPEEQRVGIWKDEWDNEDDGFDEWMRRNGGE